MSADRPPVVVALEHRVNDLEELLAAMMRVGGVAGSMTAQPQRERVWRRVAERYEEGSSVPTHSDAADIAERDALRAEFERLRSAFWQMPIEMQVRILREVVDEQEPKPPCGEAERLWAALAKLPLGIQARIKREIAKGQ